MEYGEVKQESDDDGESKKKPQKNEPGINVLFFKKCKDLARFREEDSSESESEEPSSILKTDSSMRDYDI